MAEDLLGVALMAAACGSATIGRPQLDKGIDLYLRRLRSMLTVRIQVKAVLLLSQDATASLEIPEADLHALGAGYVAIVHIPPPHDQLYQRVFLIPVDEFRRRCTRVTYYGLSSYRFVAEFDGQVREEWSPFALDIDQLPAWIGAIPGWRNLPAPSPLKDAEGELTRAENHNVAEIGLLWAAGELQRVALDRIMIVEDRVRLDPVTFLVHDLHSQRMAGIHLRTATFNKTRRIHFDVKKRHWFEEPNLMVVLVLLRPDRRVHDYVLLIPSVDIAQLGFSETLTLDPLTRRFRKYQIRADEFARTFMATAFCGPSSKAAPESPRSLKRAS